MKKALPGSVDAELEEMKKLMGDGKDGKGGKGDGKE